MTTKPTALLPAVAVLFVAAIVAIPATHRNAVSAPSDISIPVISVPNAGADALLGNLSVQPPTSTDACRQPCSILQSTLNVDAAVFVLQYQPDDGLVRLAGAACRQRTTPTMVRQSEQLKFAVSRGFSRDMQVAEQVQWRIEPSVDTYYAIAITDSATARHMANIIDKLPLRCSAMFKPGLTGDALREWLTEFAMQAARHSDFLDWRAIELNDSP